ncbi:MAG: hypothetical protein RIM33_04765 [Alphaproteobacteria bacterium]
MTRFIQSAVISAFILIASPLPVTAYELPGSDDPAFQQALEVWLNDSDESVKEILVLAEDGNIAAAAMILHLSSSTFGVREISGLEEDDRDINTIRQAALSNINPRNEVTATVLKALSMRRLAAWHEEAFILLDAGLDDLAYRGFREIEITDISELLDRRELADLPDNLQRHIYWTVFGYPDADVYWPVIEDGVYAVEELEPRGATFLQEASTVIGRGLDLPDVEMRHEPFQDIILHIKSGSELVVRAALLRDSGSIELPIAISDILNEWVSSSDDTAFLRPYCESVCPASTTQCMRAAYALTSGLRSHLLARGIKPPDGIVERLDFLRSPRGLRRMEEELSSSFSRAQEENRYSRLPENIDFGVGLPDLMDPVPCLAERMRAAVE